MAVQNNKIWIVLEEIQFQDRLAKKYVGMEYSIKVNIGTTWIKTNAMMEIKDLVMDVMKNAF